MLQHEAKLPDVDARALLSKVGEWAAQFHDDSCGNLVGEVVTVFAFLLGLRVAATQGRLAGALLVRLEDELPATAAYLDELHQDLGQEALGPLLVDTGAYPWAAGLEDGPAL